LLDRALLDENDRNKMDIVKQYVTTIKKSTHKHPKKSSKNCLEKYLSDITTVCEMIYMTCVYWTSLIIVTTICQRNYVMGR
jgi:hypothetical protein